MLAATLGRCRSLVLAAVLASSVAGCVLSPRSSGRAGDGHEIFIDESLRPQLDRFQKALAAHATDQRVAPNSTEVKLFTAALAATVEDYVDPVDPVKLVDAAIAGLERPGNTTKAGDLGSLVDTATTEMISSLDQHSAYLNPEIYQELQVDTRGRFGGVGLEITMRNGAITIVSPIEDGPAARAGIQPGDQLLAIGDVPTTGSSLVEAIHRLRGPVGSRVTLKIGRAGASEPLLETLTREIIRIQSVRSSRISGRYGYVRISQFQERTASDLERDLQSLQQTGSLDGLVLDLRNNPGGLLSQAVRIAQVFLDSGIVLSAKGRAANQSQTYYAKSDGEWHKLPVIVLVNHGSAAGSEVVAAALQANRRAQLVGSHTFGNGTIQTIIPIGDHAALRLTTARMYGPTGAALELGLQPDVSADPDPWAANVPSVKDPIVPEAVRLLAGPTVQ